MVTVNESGQHRWLAPAAVLLSAGGAHAYVGPGAGLAVAGSIWGVVLVLLALLAALLFPFRYVFHRMADRARRRRARARRVVVLGFDGMDAGITRRLLAEGHLPNLAALSQQGSHHDLQTVLPAITPAAWPTFATGVDPSGHAIFDFITRNRQTYQPELASAQILPGRPRRWRRSVPQIVGRRRGRPFWDVLADHRVFSTILRVPITWPPEPFKGLLLSGMSTPDVRGTQGEGTLLTEDPASAPDGGPAVVYLQDRDGELSAQLPGPPDPQDPSRVLRVGLRVSSAPDGARITLDDTPVDLQLDTDSAWIVVTFEGVQALCRLRLLSLSPVSIYVWPLQLNPAHPAMPISHPGPYAQYLAHRIGPFATVGLAEDTDALHWGVVEEDAFLQQVESIHTEREAMLDDALQRSLNGLVACVFDGTDRVQHMFYRTLEADHPANRSGASDHPHAIEDVYRRADETVGRVRQQLADDDALVVLSDHGFCSFRRNVDLNAWLQLNGYLHLKEGGTPGPWLADVDWSQTKAFAMGLSGLFINLRGREGQGIVEPGTQYKALKQELVQGLTGLIDEDTRLTAILHAYDTATYYDGPYASEGPDVLVGYAEGYRVSWTTARGEIAPTVFSDNERRWSGDHCVEPSLVPGVLFSNRPLTVDEPALRDVPVTILSLLGVPVPAYMKGRDLCGRDDA